MAGIVQTKPAEMAAEMAVVRAASMAEIAEAKPAEIAAVWHSVGIAEATPAEMAADWHEVEVNPVDELRVGLLVFQLFRISLEWFW